MLERQESLDKNSISSTSEVSRCRAKSIGELAKGIWRRSTVPRKHTNPTSLEIMQPRNTYFDMYLGLPPELINQSSDLLKVLIRIHYRTQNIPILLNERFIQILSLNPDFNDWPLDSINPRIGKTSLPSFRNDGRYFLIACTFTAMILSNQQIPWFKIAGPKDLPFEHDDVRVLIDNPSLKVHCTLFHIRGLPDWQRHGPGSV